MKRVRIFGLLLFFIVMSLSEVRFLEKQRRFAVVDAQAQALPPPCPLDVSNPAISRRVIPLHTPIQGITAYPADPSQWQYGSYQTQWAASGDMLRHGHMEICFPRGGVIDAALTIPFRLRTFMQSGAMAWNVNGSLVRDVVFETATAPFLANPDGESVATGHFTIDPWMAPFNDNSNITSAARNGWTNFNAAFLYRQANGDIIAPGGYFPLFTRLDTTIPEQAQFGPMEGTYDWVQTVNGEAWGTDVVLISDPLPIAPFNTFWPLPSLNAAAYGANPALAHGTTQIYADRNMHAGIQGRLLASTTGLDPSEIGAGVHSITIQLTVASGAAGIPGVALPNETLTSVTNFTVIVGTVASPITLTTPAPVVATSFDGNAIPVTYAIATLSGGTAPYTGPTCTPASGSLFSVGIATVTCSGQDSVGAAATGSFTVTVQPPTNHDLCMAVPNGQFPTSVTKASSSFRFGFSNGCVVVGPF